MDVSNILLSRLRSPNTENLLSFLLNYFLSLDAIGLSIFFVNEAGRVSVSESSKYSEKLRATLDLILHISTCLLGLIPSDHLSSSSSKLPIVQFQDLAWFWCKNFSRLDFSVLDTTFLTFSLSLRYYLMASVTVVFALSAGSLQIRALGWVFCIFLMAATWRSLLFCNSDSWSLVWARSRLSCSFSSLQTTSWSRISETCLLVGDLASCYIFSLLFSFLTSASSS